jgi:transposase InsO family protein
MNSETKLIKSRVGLLHLAEQLNNVTQACKLMGTSRDSFYRIKELFYTGGEEALREISRRKPIPRNRVEPEIEEAVVQMAFDFPAYGQARVCNELRKRNLFISAAGVRCVWQRHNLEIFSKRLKALEERVATDGLILTEAQLIALERKREKQEAHGEIETEHPGYLVSQDTYFVGTIKGVGRIYQQTVIDTYSRVAFAKLYTSKHAITSAEILNDRVLPFFEQHEIPVLRMLTDRGTEFNGRPEVHEYELYLQLENIDHSRTKVRHPQSNGICERLHRTMQEGFYAVTFRRKLYQDLASLQTDLDTWVAHYNHERPHSGRYCFGKTPMDTFMESLNLAKQKQLNWTPAET